MTTFIDLIAAATEYLLALVPAEHRSLRYGELRRLGYPHNAAAIIARSARKKEQQAQDKARKERPRSDR